MYYRNMMNQIHTQRILSLLIIIHFVIHKSDQSDLEYIYQYQEIFLQVSEYYLGVGLKVI